MEQANNHTRIDFVALAVHKLKTPLSSVKLSLQMLLDGDFGDLSTEQRKIIERIVQKNDSLICLVKDLPNLSKFEAGHFYKIITFDFKEFIKTIIDGDKEAMRKKGITLTIENPKGKAPKIMGDREKLFSAFQNIFDNAVKYSHINGEIALSYAVIGEHLEIKIQDHGIGILESDKDHIFTEFFRGENAIGVEPIGSGLGLYIAKSIIEGHHGTIRFESTVNKGTTFFINLPLKFVA